ncbi:acyltransferase family protein [Sporolactobacillus sp. Y61]|jgi:fucose 4-O-acetylase-like acetyltransferase|uniref:Acyltransferase family protein n=1 Tax=Sporolactobacillus sp. Y61 TaxID=3160863 RepID=A0AAU8IF88_9BACL|nr:acyltransferase family protein [Sporolactobacillus sp. THM19-2]RYL94432.1 acyltransferase [Sporolactobacillus sp. THM19-2]
MSKKRSSYFDNAKFFLILLVVFGHSLTQLKSNISVVDSLYTFIFIFHMPAFILISGFFSKHFNKPGYVRHVARHTLIPYFIFQLLYSIFYYATGYEDHFTFSLVTPHWTLWFLISMLFWKLMVIPFSRLGRFGLPVAVLVGISAGFFDGIGTEFSASRTLAFFPFFYLGYLLKSENFRALLRFRWSRPLGVLTLAALYAATHFVFPKALQDWVLFDSSYHTFGFSALSGGLTRLSMYGITCIAILAFMMLIPRRKMSFTPLGKNTLYIYLLHGFFIKLVVLLPVYEKIKDLYQYGFLFLASVALCYFLASRPVRLFTEPLVETRIPRLSRFPARM